MNVWSEYAKECEGQGNYVDGTWAEPDDEAVSVSKTRIVLRQSVVHSSQLE
jgi:hypothetical protein